MTDWANEIVNRLGLPRQFDRDVTAAIRSARETGRREMALWAANGHQEYADNYLAIAASQGVPPIEAVQAILDKPAVDKTSADWHKTEAARLMTALGFDQICDPEDEEAVEKALADELFWIFHHLPADKPAVGGMVMVPVEPTEAMLKIGRANWSASLSHIYKAMLSAAPAPPAAVVEGVVEDDWMGIEFQRKKNIAMRDAVKFIDQNIPKAMADAFYEIGPRHSGLDTDYYCRIERWEHDPKIDTCVRRASPMECAIEAIEIFKQPYKARAALAAIPTANGGE